MSNAVPVGWGQYRIADVLRQEKVKFEMNDDESYPLLSVRRRNGGFFHRETLKGKQILTKTLTKAIPESFVISKMQVVHGACGIIEEPFYDGYLSASYVSFLSKDNRVHIPYFNYLCHTPLMYRLFLLSSHGVHIEKMTFDVNDWLQKKVVLPPLPEQQKIAAILSSVDNVIEKTRAQVDKLKDLKIGMMQGLLTKGIGHTEYKDSPVGRIPVNWEITNLGSIVTPKGLQTGPFGSQLHAHEYVERGVPVVMPKDMNSNRIDPTSIAHIPETRATELGKHRVQKGDLLFARRGDIGRFALVEKVNNGWVCGTGCLKARLSPSVNPTFISCYLTLTPVIEWLNLHAVGQTMLNLNTSILAELPIILPPAEEQKIIGNAISALDSRINLCRRKLVSVENAKKALMQDLLTGKVRVNVDQKEPAVA